MAAAPSDAKRALAHFLELADKGPALRAALAEEVSLLLAAWPDHYPAEIRAACEALFEQATRGALPPVVAENRNASALVTAAREGHDFPRIFAERIGISRKRADGVFVEPSGRELAIACRGAHLGRPAFSAIAILTGCGDRLEAYESVPEHEAERTLDAWRAMDRFSRAAA